MLDVVAFAAHPDDAEAACGGLLAKLARRGYQVAICDLTRGELSSNGTPAIRAREAAEAAAQLGLAERLQLGLPDGGLDEHAAAQVEAVVRLLRAQAPRLVIAPDAGGRHPDHNETLRLVRRAHFLCAVRRYLPDLEPVVRPVLLRALDWRPMRPDLVVDIGEELEVKLQALRCYRSQFERQSDSHPTVLNDPAWLERIANQARHYGQMAGCSAAEPYRSAAPLVVDDPVRFLAAEREVRP